MNTELHKDAEKYVHKDEKARLVQRAQNTQEVFDISRAIYARKISFTHRYGIFFT